MPTAKEKRDKRKQALTARRTQEETVFGATHLQVGDIAEVELVMEEAKDEVGRIVEEKGLKEAEYHSGAAAQLQKEKEEVLAREHAQEQRRKQEELALLSKRRKRNRMTADELCQHVDSRFMSFVETSDASAPDPVFCIKMKGVRNSVPVPAHWTNKRAFLSQQTDREHGDYVVPDYVKVTGVHQVRADPTLANRGFASLLRNAFLFPDPRDTNKPPTTKFGEAFYENKDLTAIRNNFIPGKMSDKLKTALGMGDSHPPPWLSGMQTLQTLPPSYPTMKIPGLNAPIPPAASWGPAVGQWGAPARRKGDEALVFPGVLDRWQPEASGMSSTSQYWGAIRPETRQAEEEVELPRPPIPAPVQPVVPVAMPAMPAHFMAAAGATSGMPPGMSMPNRGAMTGPPGVPPPPPGPKQFGQEYLRQNVGANAQGIMAQNVVLQQQPPR